MKTGAILWLPSGCPSWVPQFIRVPFCKGFFMFESLESRRLFTSVSLSGGVLQVNGGASDDLITVSEDQGAVHVEWSTSSSDLQTADYNGVTAININGGRGNDAIYYEGN